MSTVQETVISTPELLELILSHLTMRDLLVTAPLVCKTWQFTTLTPTLQRALFFQADLAIPSSQSQSAPLFNPLLVELFPAFFAQETEDRWHWPNADMIMAMPWSKAPDAFRRQEASWRRMLVTQPPARTMIVSELRCARSGRRVRRSVLRNLELRMGLLYDIAVPFVDRVSSAFYICWGSDVNNAPERADLALNVIFTKQCKQGGAAQIDDQFYTEDTERVEIDFGHWEVVDNMEDD
ncbi:hypothetical protein DFH06DRAFT_1309691 [Mycena polygramma]|nr:hypothetical protein DFH06DRAFT_1309691 [Mycena polygramma]